MSDVALARACVAHGSHSSYPLVCWRGRDGQWSLYNGDEVLARYPHDQLRISFVWRARCFADEAERQKFADDDSRLSVDSVVETLVKDLRARRVQCRLRLSRRLAAERVHMTAWSCEW